MVPEAFSEVLSSAKKDELLIAIEDAFTAFYTATNRFGHGFAVI
jgi:hypothetical protein